MYCKHCGKQIDNDSSFCQQCGKGQQSHNDIILLKSSEGANKEDEESISAASKKISAKTFAIISSVIVAIVIFSILFFSGIFGSHRKLSAAEIADLSDSVLTLYVYDKNHDLISTGSGFVVNDDKTIVTNYHVIDQGHFVEAVSESDVHYNVSGATFFNETDDIAVLQFETGTGLPPLVIADSSSAKVGDIVYAIGSPLGLKNTVSNGIISAIREEGKHSDFQITAPISSGSSGGVLLNIYGEVIGITYASYLDGQNLNLAIPSMAFIDKLQNRELQKFEDIALFNSPLGNSVENYSAHKTRLVQHGDCIFEAYNSNNEISVYDVVTKKSKKLGISGTNLSVYRGVLYYVSSNSTIGTYNISTGKICENILLNYPAKARVDTISDLYVSNHGISVIYDVGFFDSALIQLDFEGDIIGDINNLPSGAIMADADTLVGYDYKNWEIVFISLPDFERTSIPVDFEPGSLCADKDGYLYITDTTKAVYGNLVKFDLHTGEYARIARLDAATYGCFVYDGKIFYPATKGTAKMPVLGALGEMISEEYVLNHICFSEDGKLYGIGTIPSEFAEMDYTEYYIRMNLDGKQLEVLDSKEVKW